MSIPANSDKKALALVAAAAATPSPSTRDRLVAGSSGPAAKVRLLPSRSHGMRAPNSSSSRAFSLAISTTSLGNPANSAHEMPKL